MGYRVMLVERDRLMLEQLAQTVQKTAGFELAARYQSPSDALGQGAVFQPNLILLDADGANASALLGEFCRAYPGTAILCMGEQWQAERASHFVQAGAKGYIVKPFTSEELKEAVDSFARSGMEVSSETITFSVPRARAARRRSSRTSRSRSRARRMSRSASSTPICSSATWRSFSISRPPRPSSKPRAMCGSSRL